MKRTITINGRRIGPGEPPYVTAEMSGNHNGDISRALELLERASSAGVDAVKLQTYTADTITINCDGPEFKIEEGLWRGKTLYELYQEAHTPWEWHEALFKKGRELGLTVFSSPFDHTAVDFLERLETPAYKIASFEIVDIPLIEKCASTGKPLIISTGMADIGEINEAVDAAKSSGCKEIALLHCVSGYPADASEYNLQTISNLSQTFGLVTGISDHTLGIAVSIAAVALGACIVEKHYTLRREDGGPDAAFSLEPEEIAALTESCREAWKALGAISYDRKPSERNNMIFRRSLYAVRNIEKGEYITDVNVRSIRPGYGIHTRHLEDLIGRRAKENIKKGTPLKWELVE